MMRSARCASIPGSEVRSSLEALFRSTDFLLLRAVLYTLSYGLAVPLNRRSFFGGLLPDLVRTLVGTSYAQREERTKDQKKQRPQVHCIPMPCKKRRLPLDHFSAHLKPRKRIYLQSFLARAFI
jgi:hypothetical protein